MPTHTFRWAHTNAAGMDAEHLLRRYGIPVSNRYVGETETGLNVPARQAQWAEYILLRAGYPITSPLLNPKNQRLLDQAQRNGASRPAGGGRIKRQGIAAKLHAVGDELFGPGQATRERTAPPQTSLKRKTADRPIRRPSSWFARLFGIG
jgi:hypothetical protein